MENNENKEYTSSAETHESTPICEERYRISVKKITVFFVYFMLAAFLCLGVFRVLENIGIISYTGEHFGIQAIKSDTDYDADGIDDYTDILLAARKDAENKPSYDGKYWSNGGYPPDNIGVCTDVIWRALAGAGYCLRDMVHNDIISRPEEYPAIGAADKADRNIDFRRVRNLRVFFDKYALALTTDISDIEEWQPGDIVIMGNNTHIGIISDKRNRHGIPYLIHNGGQPRREEDYLSKEDVVAHYRFDASQIPTELLIPFE